MDTNSFLQTLFSAWSHQPILLGITFGLVHAFDADHVSAIGGLAVGDRRTSPTAYAFRWAIGHAAALALFGIGVLGLGLWGLAALSGYAELLVSATLLAVGAHAVRAARRDLRVRDGVPMECAALARADGAVPCNEAVEAVACNEAVPLSEVIACNEAMARSIAVPCSEAVARSEAMARSEAVPRTESSARAAAAHCGGAVRLGNRAGMLMGVLHGGAGSAAVIALVPVASFDTGLGGGLYLAFFSLGVLAGACAFSQMLGRCMIFAERGGARLRAALQGFIGAAAILTGALLFAEVMRGG